MQALIKEINALKKTEVKQRIDQRLQEFAAFKTADNTAWFSELCFCLLTANAKSKTACAVQQELGYTGFATASMETLVATIKKNKHRFHNTKAKYIYNVRQHQDIRERVLSFSTIQEAREWLVENIKGYGYKEASHFLRNVGFFDLAILDRHILHHLHEHKIIRKIPSSLNKNNYLEIEEKMKPLCSAVQMSQGELDMYLWYMKAGDVLK